MKALSAIIRLSLFDLKAEWRLFLSMSVHIAAIIAPLLLFAGLRSGYLQHLEDKLIGNPQMRQIFLDGQYRLDQAWFTRMEGHAEVGFLTPKARHTNLGLTVRHATNFRLQPAEAELIPSGPGDPLLSSKLGSMISDETVIVSARLAEHLEISAADRLTALITRTTEVGREAVRRDWKVAAILPIQAHGRDAVFADAALMLAIERYREGGEFEVEPLRENETVASFRLYANTIDDVEPLRQALMVDGKRVETSAAEIHEAKQNSGALSAVVGVLAAIIMTGGFLSISSALGTNVLGKSRELSTLRMLGYRSWHLCAFPITQSVLVGLTGGIVGVMIYAVTEMIVVKHLADDLPLARDALALGVPTAVLTVLCSIVSGTIAALWAAWQILKVDPTARLRDA